MWITSLLLIMLFTAGNALQAGPQEFWQLSGERMEVVTLPMHTLFLLLCGVAIAWRFQSSLVGLLVLVPVACLPFVAASIFTSLTADRNMSWFLERPLAGTLLVFQLVGCIAALAWGWRAGSLALRPVRIRQPRSRGLEADRLQWQGLSTTTTYTPFSALLWQSFRQNSTVTLGCSALAVVAIGLSVAVLPALDGPNGGWLALSGLMAYASVSWLGVSVFAGDRLHDRIRFLADRGISSRDVAHASGYTFLARRGFLSGDRRGDMDEHFSCWGHAAATTLMTGSLLGTALFVYLISQWVGQQFTSPIVAGIAAPTISLAALAYNSFALDMLGAPIWLLACCALIPIAVTYALTQRWMASRFDVTYWMTNAAAVAAFLLVPVMPFAHAWSTTPGMSSQTRAELRAELRYWSGKHGL